jgi:hypothetical protein
MGRETAANPDELFARSTLAGIEQCLRFGVIGFVNRAIQLGRQGDGVSQVVDANQKRETYGYWDARLKDGFHFEPVRRIAKQRLEHLRQVAKLLEDELRDDQP